MNTNINTAPVVLFVYNRPRHTLLTLKALAANKEAANTDLFIYADGPKNNASIDDKTAIAETRNIIRSRQWCKKVQIIESEQNLGLANSVIKGTSEVLQSYDRVITLEDDVIIGKHFLAFMNEALERYSREETIFMVAGYIFPVKEIAARQSAFFLPLTSTQAWGTWQRAWCQFDENATGYHELKTNASLRYAFNLDGSFDYSSMLIMQMESNNISSWAIRWWWTVFCKKGLVLYPDKSLVKNIGWDNSGTHSGGEDPYLEKKWDVNYQIRKFPLAISTDSKKLSYLKEYFKPATSFSKKIKKVIKSILPLRNK